jgi:hypothetical protein
LKTVAFTDVTIKDEDVQNIRLAVLPPKRIKITTTADQAYLGNGYLQLTPMRGPLQLGNALTPKIDPATRTVQVDGLLPIPYRLEDSVCSSTLFCYIQSMKQEGSDVAGGIIDGAVGGAVSFHIGYTETSLRTTIDLGSRKPVEGMRVTIAPEGVTAKQNDTITTRYTDADGEILWTLLPGDYKVYAWEQYHHELAKSSEFLRQFQGTSVTVKKDGQSPVKVRLITANEVEGVLASFK